MSLLIFAAVLFVVFFLIVKKTVHSNLIYSNQVRSLFAIYAAILVVCAVLDTASPAKGISIGKRVPPQILQQESSDLLNKAVAGKLNEIERKSLIKKWDFHYTGQQIELVTANNEYSDTQVVVERKSTNDQQIEVSYYQARSSVNGMVVAKKVKPLQLDLADRQLILTKPPVLKLTFSEYTNSFPIKQFTGEKTFDTSTEFFEGQSILYLQIPKNVQVTTNSEMKLITIGNQ